jgi:hypothetical protein
VRRLLDAVSQVSGLARAGDVDTLLTRASQAEMSMQALEQEKHLQADQIRALTDSIHALTRQLAEAPAASRARPERGPGRFGERGNRPGRRRTPGPGTSPATCA